jgi:hypothetical protein
MILGEYGYSESGWDSPQDSKEKNKRKSKMNWRRLRALLGFNCEFFETCPEANQGIGTCRIGGGSDCLFGMWDKNNLASVSDKDSIEAKV